MNHRFTANVSFLRRLEIGTTSIGILSIVGFIFLMATARASSVHGDIHGAQTAASPPAPFVATTSKPFSQLMSEAMAVMDNGMTTAPMNGDPDHDFAAMMIPHHQGAIDMAKVELLYGKNPALRRLAQEIIVTQESEIAVMQLELKRHPKHHMAEP